MFYCTNDYYVGGVIMRLTDKNKIKELTTLEKNKVLMTDADYKELKLGKLENIEEELGIDLVTLFKAYTNGFYVKGEAEKQYIDFENCLNATAFKNKEMFYGHKWTHQYVKLFDYGTTWSLVKEELENETNE